MIEVYLRRNGNEPDYGFVNKENFSDQLIPHAKVNSGPLSKRIETDDFLLVVMDNVGGGEGGMSIILETKKAIKNVVVAGVEYEFPIRKSDDGTYSILEIGDDLVAVFMEFMQYFKWLFSSLVFEVKTDGGVAEEELAKIIRMNLATHCEKPKPKKAVEAGK